MSLTQQTLKLALPLAISLVLSVVSVVSVVSVEFDPKPIVDELLLELPPPPQAVSTREIAKGSASLSVCWVSDMI